MRATPTPREVRLSDDRVYLNTGTWSDLLTFPKDAQDPSLQEWIASLERNELAPIRHRTYALIDTDGARLLEWPAG